MWSFALPLAITAILLQGSRCETCLTPLSEDEPLCNPSTNDSPWTGSHRLFGQGSSSLPGPAAGQEITAEHLYLPAPPIIYVFSSQYEDGGFALWTSLIDGGLVKKIDHDSFRVIDCYNPLDEENPPLLPGFGQLTGAYNSIDKDNNFCLGRGRLLECYSDSEPGNRFSRIALKKRINLYEENLLCGNTDYIVGLTLNYRGFLILVSEFGVVLAIPRQPEKMDAENIVTFSINGDKCGDPSVEQSELETISNSVTVDEGSGIFVVTSKLLYKFRYDGSDSIVLVWTAEYNKCGGRRLKKKSDESLRLGEGSGSTPSLIGTREEDDRFVVITDASPVMNVVGFWRDDEIPDDWMGLPGKDKRVAFCTPVTFGDPSTTRTLSEQSVLVRGNSMVIVNNLLRNERNPFDFLVAFRRMYSIFEGGVPESAPYGVERIDWDPVTRTTSTAWVNNNISIPNGIPGFSQATSLVYGIGQRNGVFGLEGISFDTGESIFFVPGSEVTCSSEIKSTMGWLKWLMIRMTMSRIPGSCENSFYAATEVGPDGAIYTGTFNGISKYSVRKEDVVKVPAAERADAGVRQGIDLCQRALNAAGNAVRLDATERAVVQLTATLDALKEAEDEITDRELVANLNRKIEATEDAMSLLDEALQAQDTNGQGGASAPTAIVSVNVNDVVAMAQELLQYSDTLVTRRL